MIQNIAVSLPVDWKIIKLDELAEIVSGVTKGRKLAGRNTTWAPYLRVANVQAGRLDLKEIKEIEVPVEEVEKYRLKPGDVVMTEGGDPDKLGRGAVWQGEVDLCLHQNHIFRVRPKSDVLDPYYLEAYLGSRDAQSYFLRCAKQTTGIASINMTQLRAFPVLLPPIAEQRRIAAILDRADTVRRKRQEAIRLTEELLRSAFLEMFGDPVTNPKKWKTDLLVNHITHANNGLSRRRKTVENEGEIVLRLQDVKAGYIDFSDPNRIALKEAEKNRYFLVPDDLVFIRVNGNREYVGRCSVYRGFEENVYHNDHIIRIQTSSDLSTEYLAFVFNDSSGKSLIQKQIKTSAGQYTISQKGIESIELPLPPRDLQDAFIRQCASIDQTRKRIQNSLEASQNFFNSLLQRAFRGEL